MVTELFNVGARWRHQNLGFIVRITEEIEPGRYLLGFAPEHRPVVTGPGGVQSEPFRAPDFMSSYILKGAFTAQDLIRDFESLELLTQDRWDQILENFDEPD